MAALGRRPKEMSGHYTDGHKVEVKTQKLTHQHTAMGGGGEFTGAGVGNPAPPAFEISPGGDEMESIDIEGTRYSVRQTDGPDKKWVQTEAGERIAVRSGDVWKWKVMKP